MLVCAGSARQNCEQVKEVPVPVIVVGDRAVNGYDPVALRRALDEP